MAKNLNIAVLLSGGGTTLMNLLEWRRQGRLDADIGLVVSSRENVGGLKIAKDAGIASAVVRSRDYIRSAREGEAIPDWERMSKAISKLLVGKGFDLVCMAGFMCRYHIPAELAGRVLNIHPGLIPMFCGQGMYGHRVHEAVVKSGVRVTGCTVHFADDSYDTGPIILQRACPVYTDDTADAVAERVFRQECIAYPTAINLIADDRVRLDSTGRVRVMGDYEIERWSDDA